MDFWTLHEKGKARPGTCAGRSRLQAESTRRIINAWTAIGTTSAGRRYAACQIKTFLIADVRGYIMLELRDEALCVFSSTRDATRTSRDRRRQAPGLPERMKARPTRVPAASSTVFRCERADNASGMCTETLETQIEDAQRLQLNDPQPRSACVEIEHQHPEWGILLSRL